MNDERPIREAIDRVQSRMDEMMLGTYATTAREPSPPLTYDRLMETLRGFTPLPPPLRLIEVPLYGVEVQARRHKRKKRRLQKKWLKRYGTRTEYRRHLAPGQVLHDTERNVIYAHGEEMDVIRRQYSGALSGNYGVTS